MIDIYVWAIDGITYYQKIDVCITDVHAIPPGTPPDASLISANYWRAIVGEPIQKEDGSMETWEDREAAKILALGWVLQNTS